MGVLKLIMVDLVVPVKAPTSKFEKILLATLVPRVMSFLAEAQNPILIFFQMLFS